MPTNLFFGNLGLQYVVQEYVFGPFELMIEYYEKAVKNVYRYFKESNCSTFPYIRISMEQTFFNLSKTYQQST
jgi:hypothetical protein